ncbi:protein CcmA, bactofilin family [Catalinimonas alkaloidigena]|uniref:Protein CcmA, bactofilin family n=1 Tax=Catalinimonas alkaloidigena TaxID=1075417 RepID=A0A1G9NYQ9_9BACT|nr:polymer-forming cytoskeletal protein [Catalinimonas alkaloidigena]SDL91708.1 protein CcmA, bactofilin family [Catalinimonas alkaloidigena]
MTPFLLLLLSGLLAAPQPSTMTADETILLQEPSPGDRYLTASQVWVQAPVEGDLIVAAQTLRVQDTVRQDLMAVGGELTIEGYVGDDIRLAGGTLILNGVTQGDVMVFGGDVVVGPTARILGDLLVYAGEVRFDGHVLGKVVASGGQLHLRGIIEQGLEIQQAESLDLGGVVWGNATLSARTISVQPTAQTHGTVHYATNELIKPAPLEGWEFDPTLAPDDTRTWSFVGFAVFYLLASLLVILLMQVIFQRFLPPAAKTLFRETGKSLGYGFLYLLGLPPLIALLAASVVGIPVSLFALAAYLFSLIFGPAIAGLVLAHGFRQRYERRWRPFTTALMALLATVVVQWLFFIPLVGFLLSVLVITAAFGALLIDLRAAYLATRRQQGMLISH